MRSSYTLVTGGGDREQRYLDFARTHFGADAYQANPNYVSWLYRESPLGRSAEKDLLLAVDGSGNVVGCIHVLHMSWRWREQVYLVPTLHNAMVHPDHRLGVGGMLIMQSFLGQPHAFVPGAVGKLAETYRRIGFSAAAAEWRVKWLHPIRALARTLGNRLFPGRTGGPTSDWWRDAAEEKTVGGFRLRCWRPAAAGELDDIVSVANGDWADAETFAQCWSKELFFWRFFHPLGPRHKLVALYERDRLRGYVVISVGLRRGLVMARAVDWRAASPEVLLRVLDAGAAAVRRAGAHLFLVFGAEAKHNAMLAATGWRAWPRGPQTLVYHRQRSSVPVAHAFMPSAGDYGFEAFPASLPR